MDIIGDLVMRSEHLKNRCIEVFPSVHSKSFKYTRTYLLFECFFLLVMLLILLLSNVFSQLSMFELIYCIIRNTY